VPVVPRAEPADLSDERFGSNGIGLRLSLIV
jgi:hypothetical protein